MGESFTALLKEKTMVKAQMLGDAEQSEAGVG